MKQRYLMSMAIAALPLLSLAVPATPHPVTMTNPDGSTIEVRLMGDEHFNYVTDIDGKFILETDKTGKWVKAVRNGVYLTPERRNLEMLMSEQPKLEYIGAVSDEKFMAPIDDEGRSLFPTLSNDVHSLVVLIQYSDCEFTIPNPRQTFYNMLNQQGFSEYSAQGSVVDYYKAVSNGKFTPTFDVSEVVTLSHPKVWYTGKGTSMTGAGTNARFGCAIEEALKYLDEKGMDFSQYDCDGDGDIDTVYFFYAGFGQADSPDKDAIWPHQADFRRFTDDYNNTPGLKPLYLDGKRMGPYACSNELMYIIPRGQKQPYLTGIGTFCHEFGHVLGFPDLYDTLDKGTKTPGDLDLMDSGSYNQYSSCPPLLSGWERWVCRWLEFTDLKAGSVNKIQSFGTAAEPQAYRLRVNRPASTTRFLNEFFVFECRSQDSYDKSLPAEGMMIWRVNFDRGAWISNTFNTNFKPNYELIYADEDTREVFWPGEWGDFTSSYPGAPNEIKLNFGNNKDFRPFITNISFDPATKTASFEYNVITEFPTLTTVLHDNVVVEDEAKRFLKLEWDAVEGAEKYLLTVYRTDDNGDTFIVDQLDDADMGPATSRIVRNISNIAWDQEFTAYVRVFDKLPASNISNKVVFVPSRLQSGVDEIFGGDSVDIRGGVGCIVAPEGARCYNLSGIETGKNELPAGVYIVTYNGKAVKVTVR